MRGRVVSLFDYTGNMVLPWRDAGYECWVVDIRHDHQNHVRDSIHFVHHDLTTPWLPPFGGGIDMVFAFPPCTDLACSGARWMKGKGLRRLAAAIGLFATAAEFCEWSGAPYLIENPVGTISTYWRKPDYKFHPFEYAGLHPEDNYTKETCLWTGGGFVMPDKAHLEGPPPDTTKIHHAAPGPERGNTRSITPTGFAKAVYWANSR